MPKSLIVTEKPKNTSLKKKKRQREDLPQQTTSPSPVHFVEYFYLLTLIPNWAGGGVEGRGQG